MIILILLGILLLLIYNITKNSIIRIFIISLLATIVIIILHLNVFPYLFGHCSGCLFGGYTGIDFSREENALGVKKIDANTISINSILIIGIATLALSIKDVIKKERKIITKILIIIFTLFLIWSEYSIVASFMWA